MFSLTLLAISFTTVTITSPGIVEDIKNREYTIEKDVIEAPLPEADDLGLPKEVGQVIDICLQFGDNILTDIKLHQLASIHSLSGLYEKLHLLVFGVLEPFGYQVLWGCFYDFRHLSGISLLPSLRC